MTKLLKQFNICNIYIFIWVIYSLHKSNTQIPFIDSISNILLAFNLIISFWFTLKTLNLPKIPRIFKSINILLILFIVYGLIYIVFGEIIYHSGFPVKKGTYLIGALRSFLPIYVFYYFTKNGSLTEKTIKFWIIIFLLDFIFIYTHSIQNRLSMGQTNEFVNNRGYLFAIFLPSIFVFRKNTIIQIILISICFIFILLALKRGALFIAILVILLFAFDKLKNSKNNNKLYLIIILSFSVFFGYSYLIERFSNSNLMRERLEQTMEGNTSNRNHLTEELINHYWNKENIAEKFFGIGADKTVSLAGNWAHNDWIEILICQGLFGVLVYAYFWISFYKQWKSIKNQTSKNLLGGFFIVYFLRSIFSMTYSTINPIATLCIGYALAQNQLKTKSKTAKLK